VTPTHPKRRSAGQVIAARLTTNIEGLGRLAQCRSAQDFLTVQSELASENMRRSVESDRHVGEVSVRVADEAAGLIQSRARPARRSHAGSALVPAGEPADVHAGSALHQPGSRGPLRELSEGEEPGL
jgi:phasin family protein